METKLTWVVDIYEPDQYYSLIESDGVSEHGYGIELTFNGHADALSVVSQMVLHGKVCTIRKVD